MKSVSGDTPSITIGITAYNCEQTINKALQSALAQTYENFSILVVDDASTDNTRDALDKFESFEDKITVIKQVENKGVASCRNIIIENAKTDFIAFFDDDDISVSQRLKKQLDAILSVERQTSIGIVLCHSARIVFYDEKTQNYESCLGQRASKNRVSGKKISDAILCGTGNRTLKGACPTCVQMARTSTYRSLGGFDPNLRRSEDTDLAIRAAEAGAIFVGISEPLVHQLMTPGKDKSVNLEYTNWQYLLEKHKHIIERKMSMFVALEWLDIKHKWLSKDYFMFSFKLFFLGIRAPFQTFRKLMYALPSRQLNALMAKFHSEKPRKN